MAVVNNAKHPNAAKLLINHMMGDEKGMAGYKPYNTVGNFSVRTDVPPVKGMKALADLDLWKQIQNLYGLKVRKSSNSGFQIFST